jgi:hypothetical protein
VTLADEIQRESRARVLTIDIETQRAIVETWQTYKPFITIDNIIVDARVLCFAAKWRGKDKIIFKSCWKDPVTVHGEVPDVAAEYFKMMQSAWELLDQADILVTYNGDRFDWQWLEREFTRLGLGKPLPYKSCDLMKVNKKWFRAGQLSMKLDWSLRKMLGTQKVPHGGVDLWHDIRYGTPTEHRSACKTMREYNIGDTVKTADLFETWLPYTGLNMALFGSSDDGLLHCTKCDSTKVRKEHGKFHRTNGYAYQLYRCDVCGAASRGKRYKITTELRPV